MDLDSKLPGTGHQAGYRKELTRRAFTSKLLIQFPLLAAAVCNAPRGLAQGGGLAEGATSTIARDVASGIAKDIAGEAVNAALGSMLSSIGVNTGDESTLQAILAKLDQIEQSIVQLDTDMKTEFTQLRWETLADSAKGLIRKNTAMLTEYKIIADPRTAAGSRLAAQQNLRDMMKSYQLELAVQEWNDLLCGDAGLIAVCGKQIYQKHTIYGWKTSKAVQKSWHYFDAHQSRTWMFYCESLRAKGYAARDIHKKMATWRKSRLNQLSLLRGMPYFETGLDHGTDHPFFFVDENGAVKSENETPLVKCLPRGVLIDSHNQLMWYQNLTMCVPRRDKMQDLDNEISAWAQELYRLPPNDIGPVKNYWVPSVDQFLKLITACGGTINPDRFYAQMKNAQFSFTFDNLDRWGPDEMHIWTSEYRHVKNDYVGCTTDCYIDKRLLMSEGGSVAPADNANDKGLFILVRKIDGPEARNYWYQG
jgi:hypothetical protein